MDRGATAGLRLDGKLAAHQLQSLLHADEPEAATVDGVLRVKANSQVTHGQLNLSLCTAQFHLKVANAAMLHRILQRFLQDSEQTQRDFLRKVRGTSEWLKSTCTCCCSDNSLQKLLAAATMPKIFEF